MWGLANHDILDCSHAGKQADVLIRTGNSTVCNLIGSKSINGLAFKENSAFFRFIKSRNTIEKSSLPGSIGSDNTGDRLFRDNQVDLVDSRQASEEFTHLVGFKESLHARSSFTGSVATSSGGFSNSWPPCFSRCGRLAGQIPSGRRIIIATNSAPNTNRR